MDELFVTEICDANKWKKKDSITLYGESGQRSLKRKDGFPLYSFLLSVPLSLLLILPLPLSLSQPLSPSLFLFQSVSFFLFVSLTFI